MHDQREDYAEPGSPPDPRFSLDKLIALALAIGHLCALLLVGHILNYSVRWWLVAFFAVVVVALQLMLWSRWRQMLEPPNQDREDYADGPPPPWSPESPFQLIGYAVLAVLAGPSVLMRAVYGPRS